MSGPNYESKFAYQHVSPEIMAPENENAQPRIEMGNHPQISKKRGWIATILFQTLAFAWLVPIVALLYLNFTEYIIGASAWCPNGQCWLDAFDPITSVPQRREEKFNKDDHNLLGALQLVAKALEVWFTLIATALVYLLTMRFASKKEGLPIGYLTRPDEFSGIEFLADRLLWVTGPTPFGVNKAPEEKRLGRRVFFLIGLTVVLCVICNLMGPATAVLVIPSLQWINTKHVGDRTFMNLNSANPPTLDTTGWFWWATADCSNAQFSAQNFSCTQYPFGYEFDSWIDNYVAGIGHTWESDLSFAANYTLQYSSDNEWNAIATNAVYWAPSRQIISNLSTDYSFVKDISEGFNETATIEGLVLIDHLRPDPYDTYTEYNKSLELLIRRKGPIAGAMTTMWYDTTNTSRWIIDVDANREIRCYSYYDLYWAPLAEGSVTRSFSNYTKCIRTGSGWNATNKHANFFVEGDYDPRTGNMSAGVSVNIYSSDRAVFLPNGTLPSWLPGPCLQNGTFLNQTICNWDRLFTSASPEGVSNRTQNINTIEYTMDNGTDYATFVVDFVAFYNFTEYQLDPSPVTNYLKLVQTQNLPETHQSIHIDPSWILAAWSVNAGGALRSDRTSTIVLQEILHFLIQHPNEGFFIGPESEPYLKRDYLALTTVMQTLSLIDHSTTFTNDTSKASEDDPVNPRLTRYAQMYVWAFGLGSRTSTLGVIVTIAGAVVVVWQFVLGILDRREYRSPTELLVAALEHSPQGEFANRGHREEEMARVRFHIRDDERRRGGFSFYGSFNEKTGDIGHVS